MANASFNSMSWMSSIVRPARARAFRVAGTGPVPIALASPPPAPGAARATHGGRARAPRRCSAVPPSDSVPYCSLSFGFGNLQPSVVSHAVRWDMDPSGFFGIAYGARVMLSTPPATNTSPSPHLIARAAGLLAARTQEPRGLNVTGATETGNPANRAAIRPTFRLSSPAWFAQPR